jgi:uncharacterized membrane protein
VSDRALRTTILALSALGAGVAGYLTWAHLLHTQVACATGGCETVQSSSYAEVAGIPVAAAGLLGYLVIAGSAFGRSNLWRGVGFAATLAGFAVSVVLLYVQARVLHAYCQWCLTSDVILTLLVPLTLVRALRGGPPDARPSTRAPAPAERAPARP